MQKLCHAMFDEQPVAGWELAVGISNFWVTITAAYVVMSLVSCFAAANSSGTRFVKNLGLLQS